MSVIFKISRAWNGLIKIIAHSYTDICQDTDPQKIEALKELLSHDTKYKKYMERTIEFSIDKNGSISDIKADSYYNDAHMSGNVSVPL